MGSELDLDDVAAQSPLAQRQLKALREGLELARGWLQGWASAYPYLDKIEDLLQETGAIKPHSPLWHMSEEHRKACTICNPEPRG